MEKRVEKSFSKIDDIHSKAGQVRSEIKQIRQSSAQTKDIAEQAGRAYADLTSDCSKASEQVEKVDSFVEEVSSSRNEMAKHLKSGRASSKRMSESLTKVEEDHQGVTATAKQIDQVLEDVESDRSAVSEIRKDSQNELDSVKAYSTEQTALVETLTQKSKALIEGATSGSLGGAYQAKVVKTEKDKVFYRNFTIGSSLLTVFVGCYVLYESGKRDVDGVVELLSYYSPRAFVLAALLYLVKWCSRQHSNNDTRQ